MASLSNAFREHVRALANAITNTPSGGLLSTPRVGDEVRTFVMDVASQGSIGLLLDAGVAMYSER